MNSIHVSNSEYYQYAYIELEGTRSDHVYAEYIILISVGIVSKNVHLETNFFLHSSTFRR